MINFEATPLFLAPLAGFSDLPLRAVVKRFGCDVTISEMISANALIFGGRKTMAMLERFAGERPFIVQLMGADADVMRRAVEILNSIDGIDGIDLNCGCPVPKVIKQCAGSALLDDLERLKRVFGAIRDHSNKRYASAKIRLGMNANTSLATLAALQSAGADYICVHGRTRAGGYSADVDYDAISAVVRAARVPIIANGDINAANFGAIMRRTGASGAMIGRASIGAPWVFAQIKEQILASNSDEQNAKFGEANFPKFDETKHARNLEFDGAETAQISKIAAAEVSPEAHFAALRREVVLYHYEQMLAHYGDYGAVLFRKHLHRYSKGIAGSTEFRQIVNRVSSADEMGKIIADFF